MAQTPPCATMLLDTDAWDLTLDASGNWAVAAAPYAVAQDAASEIRTFLGEVYYDTTRGLPYFQELLGKAPPPTELMRARFTAAALTVPGTVRARTFFTALSARQLSGQVQVTDSNGQTSAAAF